MRLLTKNDANGELGLRCGHKRSYLGLEGGTMQNCPFFRHVIAAHTRFKLGPAFLHAGQHAFDMRQLVRPGPIDLSSHSNWLIWRG